MEGLPACNRLDFSILRGEGGREGRKGVGGVSGTRGVEGGEIQNTETGSRVLK